jgi:hypothetical protein
VSWDALKKSIDKSQVQRLKHLRGEHKMSLRTRYDERMARDKRDYGERNLSLTHPSDPKKHALSPIHISFGYSAYRRAKAAYTRTEA